ncbi:MAG: hypothetical protein CVU55_06610 [Deltaproteobacteria bacterium HGW-Deltaproteobacteria-13]|nr:MAG: hypothetical protein CVU55_06610 [Deltaproteobacteria bacterium HGW-Deltaproteobacteria-13]
MKNAHLRRCAAKRVAQRIKIYASRLTSGAPCLWAFLKSLVKGTYNYVIPAKAGIQFLKILDYPVKPGNDM